MFSRFWHQRCSSNADRGERTKKVVNDVSGTVREAVDVFNAGKYVYSEGPKKQGHGQGDSSLLGKIKAGKE